MKHDIEEFGSTAVLDRTTRKSESAPSEADRQEIMKKAEAAGAPGPGHKALEPLVGNWKAEVKCWHEPGGEPQVSQGTAKTRWILNGRFLEEEFRGQMMGKPFTGISLIGYDNTKQTYNMVWISDTQTSIFTSEGRGDTGNKVITLQGQTDCAATGQRNMPIKTVFRFLSPDKHVFEMFNESNGKNTKTMEIIYTRA